MPAYIYFKNTLMQVISCKFCQIFKRNCFAELLWVTASTKCLFLKIQLHLQHFTLKIGFTAWKVPIYRDFSGPYFPLFRLNTERYGVSLQIQSECRKIRTRSSVLGHFSHSVFLFWFSLNIFEANNVVHLRVTVSRKCI